MLWPSGLFEETCTEAEHRARYNSPFMQTGARSMKSKLLPIFLPIWALPKPTAGRIVSNDNPYSEAQFKTLKYCPEFPERFGSIQDARYFCQHFFTWYNKEHRHSGIALMTPEQVHYGMAHQVQQSRAKTLKDAFIRHPDRFKGKIPKPLSLPEAVWINKPSPQNPGA